MDRRELLHAMGLIATYWPHWKIPRDPAEASVVVDAWDRLLGDLDPEAVVAAIEAYAVTGAEFAPGPGILRKKAVDLVTPDGIPDPDQAWAEVLDQIRSVGYVGLPTWSHPAIETTVAAFGWLALCESETQMADRAHFLRIYEDVRERAAFVATAPPSVKILVSRVATQLGLSRGGDSDGSALPGPRRIGGLA